MIANNLKAVQLFFVFSLLSAFLMPNAALGSGYFCGFELIFDTYEFSPGSEIPIKVHFPCYESEPREAIIIVSDGDSLDIGKKFLEQKVTVQGITEIKFKPSDQNKYRFLISVINPQLGNNVDDQVIVFTKPGASKISIVDYSESLDVSAGTSVPLRAKVVDGLGKEVNAIHLFASITRISCEGYGDAQTVELTRSDGVFSGNIEISNDIPTGTKDLSIFPVSPRGYQYESVTIKMRVTNNETIPVTILFHNMRELNSSPFGGQSVRTYVPSDNIIVKGQTLNDACLPLGGVEVTGDLAGSASPIIRDHAISDENGNFTIHFQTYPQMKFDSYTITLKATHNGTELKWYDTDVRLENIQRFTFYADGKNSTADVKADPGTHITSLSLDKDSKKLVFVGTNDPSNQGQFTILIPSELLSGDILVQSSEGATVLVSGNNTWADTYGPVFDEVNDPRHTYGLNVGKNPGFTNVFYYTLTPGEKKLEIIGTTAIPEFPSLTLLTVGAVFAIIFLVKPFSKLKFKM